MKLTGLAFLISAAFAASWLGAGASSASAVGESFGESYGPNLESICKASADRYQMAGPSLSEAARDLKRTYLELAAVPVPAAEEASLVKWLGDIETEAALYERASKALATGNRLKVRGLVRQLDRNAKLANQTVSSLHLHFCILAVPLFTKIKFDPKSPP